MSESILSQRASSRVSVVPVGQREELLALAEGIPDLVELGRGDPDLDTPVIIVEAAIKALNNGYTHYTHWAGMEELRQAISAKLNRDNGLNYDPNTEIVVTTGVQEAMYVVFQCLLDPGDEVLIADPLYTAYNFMVTYAGGRIIHVPIEEKDDFVLQPSALLERITPKTKAIVVITPNNPTGAVIPGKTLKEIADLAIEKDLLIISDEIYEKIIFDGARHVSISSFPGMYERSIVLNGLSKAYSMTGWRLGYMAAPKDFIQKCRMLKYALTISVNHATQAAAVSILNNDGESVRQTLAVYDERRRSVMSKLDEMGLAYCYPKATFYIFVNITSTGLSSFEFCRRLLQDAQVQVMPGTAYGNGEGYIRISLTAPLDQIERGMDRMASAVRRYQNRQS
jgi:aminotransferase